MNTTRDKIINILREEGDDGNYYVRKEHVDQLEKLFNKKVKKAYSQGQQDEMRRTIDRFVEYANINKLNHQEKKNG